MYFALVAGVFLALLNCLCDLSYCLYMACIVIYSNLRSGSRKILDADSITGVCLTTDLDFMFHMNNSRYLRECDFGRFKFLVISRVWHTVKQLGGTMTVGAQVVRYRRAINLFNVYSVNTRIIYWDDSAFYIEQALVRKSDGFIYCLVIIKQAVIGAKVDHVIEKLGYPVTRPEILPEVAKWIESIQLSSDRLRNRT